MSLLDYSIKKRDGRFVKFDENKIHTAVYKAMCAAGKPDSKVAKDVTNEIINNIIMVQPELRKPIDVEEIQDMVETILLEKDLPDIAKAFIIYRNEQHKLREEKCNILNKDLNHFDEIDKAFDINSLRVLESRYLIRNDMGEIIESPKQLFIRVATQVGIAEIFYDPLLFTGKSIIMNVNVSWAEEAEEYYNKLDAFHNKFHIGKYHLNKYHFDSLIRLYSKMFREGKIKATFKRVLELLATGYFDKYEKVIDEFYSLMVNKVFLPNTPTLMNAGSKLGQLSACFVLDIDDSLDSIMKTARDAAKIFQSGGGVGISYSKLRPEGDMVFSTSGVASGPVSFMNIINTVTEVVKQGGKRRGANMGILHSQHPDIEKFITAKTTPGVLENFNVSVGLWKPFWDAYKKKEKFSLLNPRNNSPVRDIDAAQLMDTIALSAWKSAEPGVIFFDNINKYNHMTRVRNGPITCTNPCGEQSLYPYESCNLGSINLSKFIVEKDNTMSFDMKAFENVIRTCVRFLDNVIDVNKYPIPEIEQASRETRRIGLGIMGLADALYMLGYGYNSKTGYDWMNYIAESFSYYSTDESVELAKKRGEFDLFDKSYMVDGEISITGIHEKIYNIDNSNHRDWNSLIENVKRFGMRNSWTTTIAPTGSLSMIADCSNGVEPIFSIAFEKKVAVGNFFYSNKIFKDVMNKYGIYNEELVDKVAKNYGSVKGIEEIPSEFQDVFVTAMDIHWLDHICVQAIWQQWIGNAIAKTINMPEDASAEDIKTAYLIAHELNLKGVTVYRDNSRHKQVLHVTGEKTNKIETIPSDSALECVKNLDLDLPQFKTKTTDSVPVIADFDNDGFTVKLVSPKEEFEFKNSCDCGGTIVKQGGCSLCIDCGFSSCSIG
jgi:ribonucleoside-diphosphate reductase alpha chain